ncbi:hypothetical protein Pla52o_01200 [Novipirellula galeiformis]|uniref:Uncharacterized protein n=1 Tax=Novipirellula galeiformis TaxID=2528004 RepID=A0A5C6CRV5_9BACT|nr:hypothetical protein Pla52o_01200 [Novipirellula galeiformis]
MTGLGVSKAGPLIETPLIETPAIAIFDHDVTPRWQKASGSWQTPRSRLHWSHFAPVIVAQVTIARARYARIIQKFCGQAVLGSKIVCIVPADAGE